METDVEQLFDEERFRALLTNGVEEEINNDEEFMRPHTAGCSQVGFNNDPPAEPRQDAEPVEVEEPFIPTLEFKALLSSDIVLPKSLKQNAIIEKTAMFIANQMTQIEILIKANQGDDPHFQFLNRDSMLNPYYLALVDLVKSGKRSDLAQVAEENQSDINDKYLNTSRTIGNKQRIGIESATSIPSIRNKSSADIDYSLLISNMRCDTDDLSNFSALLAAGEGAARSDTVPALPVRLLPAKISSPRPPAVFPSRPSARCEPVVASTRPDRSLRPSQSIGLRLMKNYNTDSDGDTSDSSSDDSSSSDTKNIPIIIQPPEDTKMVIKKLSVYVARNGEDFVDIFRAKNDPRFSFLEPDNIYHAYYKRILNEKRRLVNSTTDRRGRSGGTVCLEASNPVVPIMTLKYETSPGEEGENRTENQEQMETVKLEPSNFNIPQLSTLNTPSSLVVNNLDAARENNLPGTNTTEHSSVHNEIQNIRSVNNVVSEHFLRKVEKPPTVVKKNPPRVVVKKELQNKVQRIQEKSPREGEAERSRSRIGVRGNPYKDVGTHNSRNTYKRSILPSEESRRYENVLEKKKRDRYREERQQRDRYRRKRKGSEFRAEIIALGDHFEDLIDLTANRSDFRANLNREAGKANQLNSRRRLGELHRKVEIASALVGTLDSLRKKKAEEEGRRGREGRRRPEQREYEENERHRNNKRSQNCRSSDEEEADYDSPKKRRMKNKRDIAKNEYRRDVLEVEDDAADMNTRLASILRKLRSVNMYLENTIKELRSTSPNSEPGLVTDEDGPNSIGHRESSDASEGVVGDMRKIKTKREYSEGEFSNDSDDTFTTC